MATLKFSRGEASQHRGSRKAPEFIRHAMAEGDLRFGLLGGRWRDIPASYGPPFRCRMAQNSKTLSIVGRLHRTGSGCALRWSGRAQISRRSRSRRRVAHALRRTYLSRTLSVNTSETSRSTQVTDSIVLWLADEIHEWPYYGTDTSVVTILAGQK